MAAEPKTGQSGGRVEDSALAAPSFSDLPRAANSTLDGGTGSLDARAQSALLQEVFEAPLAPGPEDAVAAPTRLPTTSSSRWVGRALKSAVGRAIVAVVGVGPMQRLFEFSSVDVPEFGRSADWV